MPGPLLHSSRDRRLVYGNVPDLVATHGDVEPHNVLLTAAGPVLIDWDSVKIYSAALQAGRVAYAFGDGDAERVSRILIAYVQAGGDIRWPAQDLFISTLSHELASIGTRVQVLLGKVPPPRWLDVAAAGRRVAEQLEQLPALVERLDHLAGSV